MHVGPDTFFLRMAGAGTAPRFVDGALVCTDPDEPARDGRFDMVRDAETGSSTGRQFALEDGRRVLRALKPRLFDWSTWYVRVELDGMVFSPTPQLGTSGPGSGIGFASMDENVLAGGAAQARSAVEPEHER